jgi:poly-gamma-glutamate capsule biosynthesis protein CapA/YwtB (metallophosphatase superfamily)
MRSADISFANLEYPITRKGVRFENKTYTFRGDQESLLALRRAGIDILSIANNHIMDYGQQGLFETIQGCRKDKIVYAGAGMNLDSACKLRRLYKAGVCYGLLAYSLTLPEEYWATSQKPGTAHPDWDRLRMDIMKAKNKVDILLVSVHWGEELNSSPKPYQIELAHLAIDSGADVVLGHHPHVPQPIEIFKGKPIFYSLGNYAFGTFSDNVSFSFVAEVVFLSGLPVQVNLYPINVYNREVMFQPRLATGSQAGRIVGYLKGISRLFGTRMIYDQGVGKIFIHSGENGSSAETSVKLF